MTFAGFLVLHDPPKDRIAETIRELSDLGIGLKVVTGDNRHVAEAIGVMIRIENPEGW
ncbi:MAG TPA: hypothetical protein VKA15_12230 [Isosphaeraceae bacterium]|nr:hypothetical protein [Isosphaeraceae bacterium]